MPHCAAFGCSFQSKGNKGSDVSLHSFPNDKKRRKEWENACGRIQLPKDPRLCSRHFSPDAFDAFSRPQLLKELTGAAGYKRRLKPNAVPTIFSYMESERPWIASEIRSKRCQRQETLDTLLLGCKQPAPSVATSKGEPSDTTLIMEEADNLPVQQSEMAESEQKGGKRAAAAAAVVKVHKAAMAIIETDKERVPKKPPTVPRQTYTGRGGYACGVCQQSFYSLVHLAKHMQFHDRDRPFPCVTCGKRFLSRSHHAEHQRVHTGERPFPCDRCERSFTTHHNLKRHQMIHDKEEMFRCPVCGVLFCQDHNLSKIMGAIKLPDPSLSPQPKEEPTQEPIQEPVQEPLLKLKVKSKSKHKAKKKKKKKHKRLHLEEGYLSIAKKKRKTKHSSESQVLGSTPAQEMTVKKEKSPVIQKIAYDIEVVL